MEKNRSESYTMLMNQTNPLNLNSSYNDNVVALKILLNLCDNDEVRNLGQQILDSFILLNLLKSNIGIKQYHEEYSILVNKLHTFINKYMHFEKILRESNVRTYAFITPNYNLDNTTEEGKEAKESMSVENAYVVFSSKKEGFNGYSLNDILLNSDIFKLVLCKDKNRKFKNEIINNNLSNNKKQQELGNSPEVEDLVANKKRKFIQIVTTDELTDEQLDLFNLIEEEIKELILVDNKIILLENFIDKLMSRLFVLDSRIAKIYREYKELCEKDYEESIKLRSKLIDKINIDLITYESVLGPTLNKKETTIENNDNELYQTVASLYKNYLIEQIKNNDLENIKFSEYLEYIGTRNEIIDYVKKREEFEQQKYAEYLIYKLGDSKSDEIIEEPVMSFSRGNVA
jgi:hypothetical protein